MALRTDNGKTACLLHLGGELDVGTTTCHVGGNGNHALASCLSHDFSLALVQLGIEHIVRNVTHGEHTAEQL